MLRGSLCLLAVLTSGCSSVDGDRGTRVEQSATMVIDGRTIDIARLSEAVRALCQARREAATDPLMARSTYDRRSRESVEAIIQILAPSHAPLAASMRAAMDRLQRDPVTGPAKSSLADDLGRLAASTREGLARIGVETAPCGT